MTTAAEVATARLDQFDAAIERIAESLWAHDDGLDVDDRWPGRYADNYREEARSVVARHHPDVASFTVCAADNERWPCDVYKMWRALGEPLP